VCALICVGIFGTVWLLRAFKLCDSINYCSSSSWRTVFVHTGYMVVQLVETLHFRSEDHGFDSLRCYWNFYSPDPPDRSMALGSTQPLTGMSTKDVFWGVN
jgi:hypothetical protein